MEKIHIKNMVCSRCIQVVQHILQEQGLAYQSVRLGEARLENIPTEGQKLNLKKALEDGGFQLLGDQRAQLVEKVKNTIVQLIHQQEKVMIPIKLSVLLREKTGTDYTYLSNLFSEMEGITVEKYLIAQRIERAKELMTYDELNLSEIADKLGYSSTAHLSAQFKKITGMTPSSFRRQANDFRRPLDNL